MFNQSSNVSLYNSQDHGTGEVIREIPISCLTSDISMKSRITKLSVDMSSQELYITDIGCMLIIKVGLLDSSCSQFG